MKNIKWDEYSNESLDFVFNQAMKLIDETFVSLRQTSAKSHLVLLIYLSAFSFCGKEIIEYKSFSYIQPYLACIIGLIVSIYFSTRNFLAKSMVFSGAEPGKLLNDYFVLPDIKPNQKREMLISRIEGLDKGISNNMDEVRKMVTDFNYSLLIFIFSVFLGFVISLV